MANDHSAPHALGRLIQTDERDRGFPMRSILPNSWGRHWAQNGSAWIGFDDFSSLLKDNGEAVLAAESRPA